MNSNAASILKVLPDFDDMMRLSDEIKNMSLEKTRLDILIAEAESNVFKITMDDEAYSINGKLPSVSLIKEMYKYTGINNEILPLRTALSDADAELKMLQRRYNSFDQMLDVWRTLSANERRSSL